MGYTFFIEQLNNSKERKIMAEKIEKVTSHDGEKHFKFKETEDVIFPEGTIVIPGHYIEETILDYDVVAVLEGGYYSVVFDTVSGQHVYESRLFTKPEWAENAANRTINTLKGQFGFEYLLG
jgi:hypothetical protein